LSDEYVDTGTPTSREHRESDTWAALRSVERAIAERFGVI
jgi:hypothetical protein